MEKSRNRIIFDGYNAQMFENEIVDLRLMLIFLLFFQSGGPGRGKVRPGEKKIIFLSTHTSSHILTRKMSKASGFSPLPAFSFVERRREQSKQTPPKKLTKDVSNTHTHTRRELGSRGKN